MYRDSQVIHSLSRLQLELSFSSYVTGLTDTQLYNTRLYLYHTRAHHVRVHNIHDKSQQEGKREGKLDSRWESEATDAVVMAAALDV